MRAPTHGLPVPTQCVQLPSNSCQGTHRCKTTLRLMNILMFLARSTSPLPGSGQVMPAGDFALSNDGGVSRHQGPDELHVTPRPGMETALTDWIVLIKL